jgi:hypothetical protein
MDEKKKQRLLEELSAFLDGESSDPETVAARLERDPESAQLAKELSALGDALGRLTPPDVHPAFRTRVLAHVRETRRKPVLTWRWNAFAAMVVLAPFAAAMYVLWSEPEDVTPTEAQAALVRYMLEADENEVIDTLAARIDLAVPDAAEDALPPDDDEVWLDVLAADLSFEAWDEPFDGGDWQDELEGLTDDEFRELGALILSGANGDATI